MNKKQKASGRIIYMDKAVYIGTLFQDKRHGRGKYVKNGIVQNGTLCHNEFDEQTASLFAEGYEMMTY